MSLKITNLKTGLSKIVNADHYTIEDIEKIYDDFKEDMMKIKEELLCCSRSFIGADGFLINIRNIIDKWVK